jgi:pimeloyl-ACP methyl ester carboxylesterase
MKSIPPRRRAAVDGDILEYVVASTAGSSVPAIVLVNGAGGPIEGWYKVFEPLAALGTVLAYNRPGVGGSSKPVRPLTGSAMVSSLRGLLRQASPPPPYLMVGHSFGGLLVNLFARSFPTEVLGVVLLEATAPEDVSVMATHQTALQRFAQRALDTIFGKQPFAETEHASHTVGLIDRAGAFPPVPLVVVTGCRPAMAWATPGPALAARAEHQRRLAALSPRGKQLLAERSGHFPQITEPSVVIQAVREALSEAADPGARRPERALC